MADLGRMESFDQKLEASLDGEEPIQDGLSPQEREILTLAQRLSDLNPSQESRIRYQLRRDLLTQSRRQDVPSNWLISTRERIHLGSRLAPGISLLFSIVVIVGWMLTLGSTSKSTTSPRLTSSSNTPETLQTVNGSRTATLLEGFSPQPVPTPLAVQAANPKTDDHLSARPSKTPVLDFQAPLAPDGSSSNTPIMPPENP